MRYRWKRRNPHTFNMPPYGFCLVKQQNRQKTHLHTYDMHRTLLHYHLFPCKSGMSLLKEVYLHGYRPDKNKKSTGPKDIFVKSCITIYASMCMSYWILKKRFQNYPLQCSAAYIAKFSMNMLSTDYSLIRFICTLLTLIQIWNLAFSVPTSNVICTELA